MCLFISTVVCANVSQTEKEALIALYNTTQGEQWNTTWNLSTPIESWYGVTVEDNQVVELNLHMNNLQGTLPQEIGGLIHLRKINLGFNNLKGTLPISFFNLKE